MGRNTSSSEKSKSTEIKEISKTLKRESIDNSILEHSVLPFIFYLMKKRHFI